VAGILGMPGGVLLFIPLYHPLHDIYGLHSEVTFFILFSIFMGIIWSGDRKASPDAKPRGKIISSRQERLLKNNNFLQFIPLEKVGFSYCT
jgi:hypothetical protein